jgi:hypothetical protein
MYQFPRNSVYQLLLTLVPDNPEPTAMDAACPLPTWTQLRIDYRAILLNIIYEPIG